MILIDTLSKVVECNKFVNVQGGKNMRHNNLTQGDWANHYRKHNFLKQDKPLPKVEPLKSYTAKDMLLLTTLSMIRPNSIDNKDSLPAHYIVKRATSEGYKLEDTTTSDGITTPKNNTTEKPISHDQDVSSTMLTGAILGIAGSLAAGSVIIGSVAIYIACKSSDSKNENVDHPIDIITTPQYVLEETQDISLAGNTAT